MAVVAHPGIKSVKLTEQALLIVDLHGVVTCAHMVQVEQDIKRGIFGHANAFVLNADKALLTVTPSIMAAALPASRAARISGALVVSPSLLADAQAYAERLAHDGVVRLVFTDRVRARSWAQRQVRVAQAQEQWAKVRNRQAIAA